MFAKYKLNTNIFNNSSGATLSIPVNMQFQAVDQSDIIRTEFVDKEVELAINKPSDYDRVKLIPIYTGDTDIKIVDYVQYDVKFANTTTNMSKYSDVTTGSETKFVNDDFKYRRNNLKYTHLSLYFYAGDNTLSTADFVDVINIYFDFKSVKGDLLSTPTSFKVWNPIKYPSRVSEGYNVFHYKGDLTSLNIPPKELYMRAEFKNAKDGKATNLITKEGKILYEDLLKYTYTKYLLKRYVSGYYYVIDEKYGQNVTYNKSDNGYVVKLYESVVE